MTNRIEIEHRDKSIPQNLPLEFNIPTFLASCDPQLAYATRFVPSVKKALGTRLADLVGGDG